jgi:PAS domain S-box-containing protein
MDGVYTYASPACHALLGYEPEDLLGRTAYDFFHPDDLAAIKEAHSLVRELPDTRTVSYRIRRKDGSYTWFETTSRAVPEDDTGEAPEILAVSRDVSRRKRVEDDPGERQRRFLRPRPSTEIHFREPAGGEVSGS